MNAASWISAVGDKVSATWRFSRPHTIYGTTASLVGLYLLALERWQAWWELLPGLAIALLACLCANIYIVGLNQLIDVEIDRINKPYLPLASGQLSWGQGCWIVAVLGAFSLAVSAHQQRFLFATVLLSNAIGTAYSLPPIRLKRFPFLAALCIYTVRGIVVNVGLYLYFRAMGGSQAQLSPQVWALVAFVLVFTLAIALFKDIPDMEGDYCFHIATFSLRFGAKWTFHLCLGLLTAAYGLMAIAGWWLPEVNRSLLVLGHGGALAVLWWYRWRLPSWERQEMYRYYQLIWKLFYLEYLLFPAAHLLKS
ncbi:homogentisate phytyltransferase [Synechococcus sp. PCC 7336]|uniref:homogentisate phytyltransferase n=1 Tax=Synechococcus sp. PCC 7336 TaxID=195250 RepID=UPI000346C675|nr:homogentisate phytyltransferase [Synechococcus sp. PCC 7336]